MKDVIRLLPDSIANQIAAGEVVQRPASVVKELLENSIDAGATSIFLSIKDAGKNLVQVIDDGKGMSGTDARMSFERHATSKIQKAEDLFKIRSMGFRGEALASIAAIAQVELKTMRKEDDLGNHLIIEASEVKKQEPIQCKPGTSISVKNIFYNIPARRNFLKSNPVELRHINDEFQRVSLANSDIKFSMKHNDQELFRLDEGNLSKRIVQLFGKNYQKQLIQCNEETPSVRVTGFIGRPEFAKKTRGEQFFFINNRFIKNPYLNHAVTTAFEGMLATDHHPFYVLFIDMDPKHVDINVHPTKTEVKFDDDRLLYGVVSAAVKQSLAAFNVSPSLDFGTDVNFDQYMPKREDRREGYVDKDYVQFKSVDRPNAKNWELLYQSADNEDLANRERAKEEIERADLSSQTVTVKSRMGDPGADGMDDLSRKHTLNIHGRFLIRQVKSGMVLFHQKAVYERIFFERYQKRIVGQKGLSQQVMFPQQIELNPSDMALVLGMKDEINQLGFDFEEFGKQSIVINGVPPELANASEKDVFEGLLEQFKLNKSVLEVDTKENLTRAMAKRTASRQSQYLSSQEADLLIEELFTCEQPNFAPDGNPTFVVLSLDKIASLLN
ncbi:MAG: DNA mismatch repair endonuclease MutL [Cyclobacteriaceae bacterium]